MMTLEQVQSRAARVIRGPKHLYHEKKSETVKMFRLKKRKLQGDFLETFQYLNRVHRKDGEKLSSSKSSDRTRDDGFRLEEGRFKLGITKNEAEE